MLGRILSKVFVLCDAIVGFCLAIGGLTLVVGVHGANNPLIGMLFLVFAFGMFASAYAIEKGLSWQKPLRMGLYMITLIVTMAVQSEDPQDWRWIPVWTFVILANLLCYLAWEGRFGPKRVARR